MNQPSRIYFLDHLRALVIVLVVVLHRSITYMADGPAWWYVVDTESSLFFTVLVLLIDIPIMLIMFFIAGYFALPSLVKHGTERFMKDKNEPLNDPAIVRGWCARRQYQLIRRRSFLS